MERRVPARLTAREGRAFAFPVGAAFLVLAGITWWRDHELLTRVFGGVGGLLLLAGLLIPTLLGPLQRGWMGLAHAISKVTTPIFMGASFVTGVQTEMPTQALDASDQVAFIEAGVPGVQFFAGASPDYHKPSDTADRVDYNGLVKVASIVREGIVYLAERPEPLDFRGGSATQESMPDRPAAGTQQAATGAIPDFSYSGKGVAVGDVHEGSPAQQVGLARGDIIVAINGREVADLRAWSGELKKYAPGDEIEITFTRDGQEHNVRLTLHAR